MLKNVTVQNFVYFREKQTLDFTKGPYFLIGENDSGKSSLFEIIRRCMGIKKSTGLTKPHCRHKQSTAICQFLVEGNENKKKEVISTFMRPPAKDEKDDVYVKLVYVKSEDQIEDIGVDIINEIENAVRWRALSNDDLKTKLVEELQGNPDNIWVTLHEFISNLPPFTLSLETESMEETRCERLIKKYINKTTVITFPLRSISPCQWTKSKRLRHDKKRDNIDEVYLKEEIVSWYLERVDKNIISKEEIDLERKYFWQITNNSDFHFNFDKATKRIYVENATFEDEQPFLLKIPEGIYEAKKLSVILAIKRFKPVCLEDPERGMHPQMIDRIRDLVLTQITDKVILLISHHPSFVSPITFARVYYFRIEMVEERRTSVIKPLQKKSDDPENAKNARIFTSAQSSVLYYAKSLCLVEGDNDYVFLTTLKQLLLTNEDLLKKVLNWEYSGDGSEKLQDDKRKDFRQFLCSLHVLTMAGEANKHRYREFCSDLQICKYFLLDKDALVQNNPGKKNPKSPERFLEQFKIDNSKEMCQNVLKDVGILERHGIFMWQAGAIEDAAAALAARYESLEKSFSENNVHLEHKINALKESKTDASPAASYTTHEIDEPVEYMTVEESNVKDVETVSTPNTNLNQTQTTKEKGKTGDYAEEDKPVHESRKRKINKKLKKKGKRKLFNDDNLTNENIYTVVQDIVAIDDKDSDFRRLIKFLHTMSKSPVAENTSE